MMPIIEENKNTISCLKKISLQVVKPYMEKPVRRINTTACILNPVKKTTNYKNMIMICTGDSCKIIRRKKKSSFY